MAIMATKVSMNGTMSAVFIVNIQILQVIEIAKRIWQVPTKVISRKKPAEE